MDTDANSSPEPEREPFLRDLWAVIKIMFMLLISVLSLGAVSAMMVLSAQRFMDRDSITVSDCGDVTDFARENPGQDLVPGEVLARCTNVLEADRELKKDEIRGSVARLWRTWAD